MFPKIFSEKYGGFPGKTRAPNSFICNFRRKCLGEKLFKIA